MVRGALGGNFLHRCLEWPHTDLFLLQKCLVSPITCSCSESTFKFCNVPGIVQDARGYCGKQTCKKSLLLWSLYSLEYKTAVPSHDSIFETPGKL